ncbi:MAG: two-component sensor histidine kinase [Altererythrobacter sp.]|uniref:ATP-binding protein n=1 Tax=Altererythrobacter sp. TaxID=1872480 RepID=UPI001B201C92|nr:ATP-binding protein [Altererythrobacter sp.]MBO6642441.1 two-component sensor histidine kinase [Altererythrobacter sp.]MBO6709051.1 two-component sensor histidine kinase [Altererythrobacter sp.]
MRLLPRSLLGQVMLVLALGLFIGQAISGILLFRAAEQRRDEIAVNQIALRIINAEERAAEQRALQNAFQDVSNASDGRQARRERAFQRRLLRPRANSYSRSETSPIKASEKRVARYERALRETLLDQDIQPQQVAVAVRRAGDDPAIANRPRLQQRLGPGDWAHRQIIVAGVERADGAGWDVVRQPLPKRPEGAIRTIIFQTLVTFVILFALLFLLLRRITRPLAALTTRVSDFSENPDKAIQLEERGPEDMRRLIAAHNAMETRIAALLDEKDVMLGAIGHDLKTPLAALRVRIESVSDPDQRARMAQGIEDITRTLDDILELARIGRPSEATEPTDLAALLASLAEEYEDMGTPLKLGELPKIAAPVQPSLLRRAVRNLVDNALRYGKEAHLSLAEDKGHVVIAIEDEGPGIPAQQIAAMLEPFQRGEGSRNRATGGAGLGLTLARAIVLQHKGELLLRNRPEGGLQAEIRLRLA